MRKVRWGVISTAKIGTQKVIPAMQQGRHCDMLAIASRNVDAARQAATQLGIPKAYGSYEELLNDAEIEAIYNPLPNHLHVPWSIKAIEAGKHVLCEKPIALNAAEAQKLVQVANAHPQLKVMEAFMYRHHPQWQKARELANSGQIGTIRTIHSFFSYFNDNPNDVRNQAEIGGGGLLDIGCYCVSLSRFVFNSEPVRVCAIAEHDPDFKTDRLASGILDFGGGTATFTCGTQLAPHQEAIIFGTKGRIAVEIPFVPPIDQPARIWFQHGNTLDEISIEVCNQYTIQGDLFSQAIINDTPVPTPITDALANMKVIDSLFESARENTWIAVE